MDNKPAGSPVNALPPGLYALLDQGLFQGRDPLELARAAVKGGVQVLQLRVKQMPDREALALARALKAIVPLLVLNDRVDLALLAGCGVHVGDDDLPVPEARKLLGARALVGSTCRTLGDVQRAKGEGADYAGVGPVFQSSTKISDHKLLRLAGLEQIARQSPLPIVAISGIALENIAEVARTGAISAAVGAGLFGTADVEARARMLLNAVRK